MSKRLWQWLVVWFGLRYDVWPWWWYDAGDVTWTSVSDPWTTTATADPDKAGFKVEFARMGSTAEEE